MTLGLGTIFAQTSNSFLFIEPNVSLNYDSTVFKVKNLFSNSYYHTESYMFDCIPTNAVVLIEANKASFIPSQKVQDSLIDLSLEMTNKLDNDSIQIYKHGIPIHYKGYSGLGFIAKGKKENKYAITFYCSKYYNGGYSTIFYSASSTNKIENYDNDFEFLTSLIDGITTYNKEDYETEDSLIVAKYKVTVDSIGKPTDFREFINRTFYGKVIVTPTLTHKVKEVWVTGQNGSQIFTPQADGQIIIDFNDSEKGVIVKIGELILLNSFGKQVRVPFEFNYVNK